MRTFATPLDAVPAEAGRAVWAGPELVAEVRHGEHNKAGLLRHAVFVTLHDDKPTEEMAMDEPEADGHGPSAKDDSRVPVAGVSVSHPGRVMFPPDGPTKLDLARYYAAVAARMLVVAADRPLSLVRLPDGLNGPSFFQKHLRKGWPEGVKALPVTTDSGTEDYMTVRSAAGLVGAVQMGAVEFHIWGSRRDRLENPDRMVFDLDPDEGLAWEDVRRAAFDLRDLLKTLGLHSWPMVTGGKGVHVTVPLRRTVGWETVKLFSRTVATHLSEAEPKRFVATMSKSRRSGRIFIDYLRNERGASAIAPFSVRARPGAPVAFPLGWERLADLPAANAFHMEAALAEGDWEAVGVPKPAGLEAAVKKMEKLWR